MALTSNKISMKNIIAKVYQDLSLGDETDIGRLIEWSAETLNNINVYTQLESKPACIEVTNYKAEIPCDLVYLHEVDYNGYQLLKGASDNLSFKRDHYPYYLTPKAVNQDGIMNSAYFYGKRYWFPNNDEFIMENGWFKTSFKEGTLNIKYDALPVDEEGFPLVPDHESFRNAIFWYVAMKHFYIKAIDDDRFKWFYQDAEQKYRYYINQAGAEALMPDVFTLENIKRNYLRLVPRVDSYRDSFKNLNSTNGK